MTTKVITKNISETIEAKRDNGRYALIRRSPNGIAEPKAIILNEREAHEFAVFILKGD